VSVCEVERSCEYPALLLTETCVLTPAGAAMLTASEPVVGGPVPLSDEPPHARTRSNIALRASDASSGLKMRRMNSPELASVHQTCRAPSM
jgi:hypothetical protein